MRVEPLGDKVVIKRLEPDEDSGGIVPDAARVKPQQGRILSVGDGRRLPNGERAPPDPKEIRGLPDSPARRSTTKRSSVRDEILAVLDWVRGGSGAN
jgi:hypothetical protein